MAHPTQASIDNPLERFKREHGLTDEQLGEKLDLERTQVQRLRSGTRGPSLATALKIQRRTDGLIPVEAWEGLPA